MILSVHKLKFFHWLRFTELYRRLLVNRWFLIRKCIWLKSLFFVAELLKKIWRSKQHFLYSKMWFKWGMMVKNNLEFKSEHFFSFLRTVFSHVIMICICKKNNNTHTKITHKKKKNGRFCRGRKIMRRI